MGFSFLPTFLAAPRLRGNFTIPTPVRRGEGRINKNNLLTPDDRRFKNG